MALFAANTATVLKSRSILNVYETIGVGCPYNDTLIIRNDPKQTTDDVITLIIHGKNITFETGQLPSGCTPPKVSDENTKSMIILCNLGSSSGEYLSRNINKL